MITFTILIIGFLGWLLSVMVAGTGAAIGAASGFAEGYTGKRDFAAEKEEEPPIIVEENGKRGKKTMLQTLSEPPYTYGAVMTYEDEIEDEDFKRYLIAKTLLDN